MTIAGRHFVLLPSSKAFPLPSPFDPSLAPEFPSAGVVIATDTQEVTVGGQVKNWKAKQEEGRKGSVLPDSPGGTCLPASNAKRPLRTPLGLALAAHDLL